MVIGSVVLIIFEEVDQKILLARLFHISDYFPLLNTIRFMDLCYHHTTTLPY